MGSQQQLESLQAFRPVPRTGVIYVTSEAQAKGFYYGNPEWANLGQGAPETGMIPDAPERLASINLTPDSCEYGPVLGIKELRRAVADLYNARYRRGMASQYTEENVAISSGGRLALTRVVATLGSVNLGHFLPDYTAYEELLDMFRYFVPIPILLRENEGFQFHPDRLRGEIVGKGLGAVLLSNPCNPTGEALYGDGLQEWIHTVRDLKSALILDEFYSHYIYDDLAEKGAGSSGAAFVEDVDRDPVVILDGLTKNWRYPGLRLSWTIGPKEVIKRLASAGSFLDGGPPHPIQKAVLPLLEKDFADQEARAIQKHFVKKRDMVAKSLEDMGFVLKNRPKATFYFFPSLENMPEPLQNGMDFFRTALECKVICVPGVFFDVNPGQRRHIASRLTNYLRISYGPQVEELERGLAKLANLIRAFK